ncbi:MAG: hypothetical protein CL526_04780 [Aequorivita sp.]|nr:hypothetical protein [Aequorivita sp.]|tara:strand:- start:57785 stop:58456 length:672 start_codon:yes stop_codon:yes gene_type:complete
MASSKQSNTLNTINDAFRDFILKKDHPCIMANTVFSMDKYSINYYDKLGSIKTAKALLADLTHYVENYNFDNKEFESFIAVFPETEVVSEIEFEKLLWQQLQFLHNLDTVTWDENVSSDPEDSNFSFSLAGKAFYVVGLHPKASRMARRAPYTTLVFNLHSQFEKLREMGVYKNVRDKIRERDKELQGSVNPVLEDFGESSEARQYSGRNVGEAWKCPFHNKV